MKVIKNLKHNKIRVEFSAIFVRSSSTIYKKINKEQKDLNK
jgi:hypothetical protein